MSGFCNSCLEILNDLGGVTKVLFIFIFYVAFSTIHKLSQCNQLIAECEANPCQANADRLLKVLNKLNAIHRTLFKVGGQGTIRKETWQVLYTAYIYPSNSITSETKQGIRGGRNGCVAGKVLPTMRK